MVLLLNVVELMDTLPLPLAHPEGRCPTVLNKSICASEQHWSVPHTNDPIGARIPLKYAMWEECGRSVRVVWEECESSVRVV